MVRNSAVDLGRLGVVMFTIYCVGVFLGLLLGIPVGFWWGARHIEKLIERRQDEENAALMELLDWKE